MCPIAQNPWPQSLLLFNVMTWINTWVLAGSALNCTLQNKSVLQCPLCEAPVCLHGYFIRRWSHSPALSFPLQTSGRCLEDSGPESGSSSPPKGSEWTHNTLVSISWLANTLKEKTATYTWSTHSLHFWQTQRNLITDTQFEENTSSAPTGKHPLVGVGQMSSLISHIIIHVPPLTLSASMLVNMPTSHKVILTARKLWKLEHWHKRFTPTVMFTVCCKHEERRAVTLLNF